MSAHRLLALAWCLLAPLLLLAAAPAHAQASEQAVKAAFLPKFARYIDLPAAMQPAAGQPYYLCVIGGDPFGKLLDEAAANEVIDGHPVAVRRFATTEPGAVAGCQLAFLAGATDQQTGRMIEEMRKRTALTITDERTGKARGMIHFAVIEGRVRFFVDQAAATERSITISSRLLALAAGVKP